MALIGNMSVLNKSCAFFTNGTSTAGDYAANTRANWDNASYWKSKQVNMNQKASFGSGYNLGETPVGPIKSGELASNTRISGVASTNFSASPVRLSQAVLSGLASVSSGNLSVLLPVAGSISGVGSISNASLLATSALSAILAGVTSISSDLSALVPLSASLAGTSSMSTASLKGFAAVSATIEVGASVGLSASDVWNYNIASISGSGLAGTKLNDASSAGNPWTEVIESGYTAEEVLRILFSVAAGKTNIVDNGGGSATVTFRDIADTKDRIEAEMIGSERDTVTLDAS
jgi:hypothetical protein